MQTAQILNMFSRIIGLIAPYLFIYFLLSTLLFSYKFFTTKDAVKAWCKKRIWSGVISIISLFAIWALTGLFGNMMGIGQGGSSPIPSVPVLTGTANNSISYDYYRNNYQQHNNNGTISDTRDFTKKSFTANLQTRKVEDTAKKVEVLVKGVDGRIDSSDISSTWATITFVIPKDNLNDFEEQLKTYTHKKLYTQRVSSQNLLGEKQNLERNQNSTKSSIASLTTQQQALKDNYSKRSTQLKSNISTISQQVKTLQSSISRKGNELSVATDTLVITEISQQIDTLQRSLTAANQNLQTLNTELANTTSVFTSQMSILGYSLDQQSATLADLGTQTENFLDKVETVEGSVTVRNISYLELFDIFSPIKLSVIIIIAIILLFLTRTYFSFKEFSTLIKLQKSVE